MSVETLSISELVEKIRSGELSQSAVFETFAGRVKELDAKIEAFNLVSDTFPTVDENLPLAGIPIGVKDVFCEKDVKTTASSRMLENFSAPYESTVTARLKAAGAVSMGKLNMDEFAMGGSGENSATRITKNPWALDRIPGGSSAGSAAAVAAGLVPAALGTDTGGSIRQPASMCGIVGFKPTYGRLSRYGVIAMASSLDTPGFFSRTVRDSATLYEIAAGHDPLDSTSLDLPAKLDANIWNATDLKGVKIGIPKEYFVDGMEADVTKEIRAAIEKARELGAEIKEISLPHTEYGLAVYYVVMPAEVSTNLARYDGLRFGHSSNVPSDIAKNRSEGFGKEAQRRIMLGSFVLSSGFYDAYYKKAAMVRELIKRDFDEAFKEVDVIFTPTSPSVAWKIGDKSEDPLKMYLSDIFTVNASLAQLPGLSLPVGYGKTEDGSGDQTELPIGLQILGPRLGEEAVFKVSHVMEKALASKMVKKPNVG